MRAAGLFILDVTISLLAGVIAYELAFAAVQHFEGGWVRGHVHSSTAGVGIWVDSWGWGVIAGILTAAILCMVLYRRRHPARAKF